MALTIKSEAEYDSALARIHTLWHAEPGTPEGVERDALFDAVEIYEAEHEPIDEPTSYATIEYHLDRLNLTVDQLPLSASEKAIVAECIATKALVPETLVHKLSEIFKVSRETLGISDASNGRAAPDYVLGHGKRSH